MRKQTKLVAVLSAAALLAIGASMTSFAAGWEKDEAGIWHYYDSDDEMITGEWKKDGAKWFYLDDDGEMATDQWIDDEYYVGEDGAMLVNEWKKTYSEDDIDDPDEDGENWYYFGSKGKKTTDSKKINGKTYYFDTDGKMYYGWHADDKDNVFYLGGEDEGWRNSGWLWLEAPDADDDDEKDAADAVNYDGDKDGDPCDEEGWYYFGSDGKMYKDAKQKKVNGRYYYFNAHGQMLYEWINGVKSPMGSNANLDSETATSSTVNNVRYMNVVEEGWRADGWYEIDGVEALGNGDDTDWYYFKDGKPKKADTADTKTDTGLQDGNDRIYTAKIKVEGKNYCFNEYGQMLTGLQMISGNLYYFDNSGYLKTGKISDVEEENDSFTYYFETKSGKNGQGVTGEKSGYLYWNGKRLEADDDYKLYKIGDAYYLVNNKGKLQKSESKDFELENKDGDEYRFSINRNSYKVSAAYAVDSDGKVSTTTTALSLLNAEVPAIELYDSVISLDANGAQVVMLASDFDDFVKNGRSFEGETDKMRKSK